MTVTSDLARADHLGNGVRTTFSTGFAFLQNSDVLVIHVATGGAETPWTEGTHYTLTGADTGLPGTITVRTSPTNYTPQLGERLTVLRRIALVQPLSGDELASLTAGDLEVIFDGIVHALQMQQEILSRAVIGPPGAGGVPTSFSSWYPLWRLVGDGERRIVQIQDWAGGTGTKPPTGYLGAFGVVANVADAVDLRGSPGSATGLQPGNNLSDLTNRALAFLTLVQGAGVREARGGAYLNIESFDPHGDSDYIIPATSRVVGTVEDLTAPRTWTLPSAAALNPGQELLVADFRGTLTLANTLTLARAGSDTINGGASVVLTVPHSGVRFTSDGVSRWNTQLLSVSAQSLLDTIGITRGSLLYRGNAGWATLAPGTSGLVLKSNGPGADPSYQADAFTAASQAETAAQSDNTKAITPLVGRQRCQRHR
jgi:hypothetical protein